MARPRTSRTLYLFSTFVMLGVTLALWFTIGRSVFPR
jgi:hypothetical protein